MREPEHIPKKLFDFLAQNMREENSTPSDVTAGEGRCKASDQAAPVPNDRGLLGFKAIT